MELIGKTIDQFEILEKLGEGASSHVYKAFDPKLERVVVIKLLKKEHAQEIQSRERFFQEAKLASSLDHPNISGIFGVESYEKTYYIVMQYVLGTELKQLIRPQGMALHNVLNLAMQVAEALSYSHKKDVVHRDIKPSNILVETGGHVKILDFGLAIRRNQTINFSSAQIPSMDPDEVARNLIGTPLYSSPELATGRPGVKASDVFSFGILLHQMLGGKFPFVGKDKPQVLKAIAKEKPVDLGKLKPDIPKKLLQIVYRCLEKELDKRYPDMVTVASDLRYVVREYFKETGSIPGEHRVEVEKTTILEKKQSFFSKIGHLFKPSKKTESIAQNDIHLRVFPKTRVVVLPFVSNDLGKEKPFDATESISTILQKAPFITVISHELLSSHALDRENLIALVEEKSINFILHGSYKLGENEIRFYPKLIQTQTAEVVWQEDWTFNKADPIWIQDEISSRLHTKLEEIILNEISKSNNQDHEGDDFLKRGQHMLIKGTYQSYSKDDLDQALTLIRESIHRNAENGKAYAELGKCYMNYVLRGFGGLQHYSLAEKAFQQASSISPSLESPKAYRIYLLLMRGEKKEAWDLLNKLIRAYPESTLIYSIAANLYRLAGLYGQAINAYAIQEQLMPSASTIGFSGKGRILLYQGKFDDAITTIKKGLELEKEHLGLKSFLAYAFYQKGDFQTSLKMLETVLSLAPSMQNARMFKAMCLARQGKEQKAKALIDRSMINFAKADADGAYWLAGLHAIMLEKNMAMNLLQRAFEIGYENYPAMHMDDNLLGLKHRSDFNKFMKHAQRVYKIRVKA